MQIETKYFGQVAYEAGDVIHFPDGLFGFEEEKEFLLLPFADSEGMLLCFQSMATPQLAFVAMNPFTLKKDYAPILQKAELEKLGVEKSHDLSIYTLCVVRDPISESTINLKCPIAINEDANTAMQVILDDGEYEMRHRLSEFSAEEAKPC